MSHKKKIIFNCIFLLVCFALTMYYVFHGQDFSKIMSYVKDAHSLYWLLGVVLVIGFILGESVIIFYLMRSLGKQPKLNHCFLYSFVGFFFSLVTPSATGGQPAQVLFMKKDKLPVHLSTLVLLLVTITYKLVLVIIGIAVLILRPSFVMTCLDPIMHWVWLGIFLNVLCVGGMLCLVFSPGLAKRIVMACFFLLKRFTSSKKVHSFEAKLSGSMDKYSAAASYFEHHKRILFNVLALTFLQRIFLFFITWLVLCSFDITGINALEAVTLQAMISVAVDMLPLPGGMGISEHLFQAVFLPICGSVLTIPVMIVSRGISFYTQLFISAVFTVIAYFVVFREGKEKKNDRIL